ncbi:ribosome hibernation-promoting factor, HPF/YfiA family [Schwartzia succinivorans]|uniref:Ribosome hibernation promoting factor n=1 Tax=Schwartzia succinivorans DSM 10502 TaxID=1123243 RepID=A0A1M4XFD0_9FIRM|nr:ribosome-associated translation inhibitor RaiA [Schwartzia succinivorans]MBQ1470537.1 ribosome-associated translation inhibitor RaiA [Schwartzia sp. (in: firmicutes)]MBE6098046.1 ribosome-associated translation inhibitor RaiA [Schwartzia succinivorans]MBQ3862761.1 ribosome-associated translation inhibitor RaiA [Schwartzia sp. (in: firmicutes)]MDY6295753.1 ribosome-associated translation inhibitor RaiA [Schwartzia succinivorans]SHE92016.1 putative sigma-54 modulation protein [Schwartzia succ
MATFTVRGKNMEITPALRDYVEKRVGKVTKYFEHVGEITVLLTVSKGRHIVEVTVPVEGGVLLRGEEATMDMYTSIDLVVEKLERQIHKHKTKLQRRFRGGGFKADMVKDEARPAPEAPADDEDYTIVKTKRFTVKPMDVQEAIMEMNMLNHDFYMFRNAETEEVCVVYRRTDGNYGLIEPGN